MECHSQVLSNELEKFNEIVEQKHPIFDAIKEISQPRTKYQINKFVIGQHDTDEQRYKQVLLEIRALIANLQRAFLTLEKTQIQYDKVSIETDPIKQIDAKLLKLDIGDLEDGIESSLKELDYFMQVWESWEHKYTSDEIEQLQPIYWSARLNRQASLEAIGNQGIVNWASLDALHQIGSLPSLDPTYYLKPNIEQNKREELS